MSIQSVKSAVNLMLYSIAFGGGVMHSFVVSPIAFKHISREEFSNLQNKVFPIYFIGQATVPVLLGLTSPISAKCGAPLLALSAIAGALNYFWILPICKEVKEQRNKLVADKLHEEIIDGVTKNSAEFTALSKKFGMYHGISSLFNIVSLATLGVYGVMLAKRF